MEQREGEWSAWCLLCMHMHAHACTCMHMHAQCRFNEGVTDILAKSIVMVGAPREVFAEYKLSHVPTM